MKYISEKMDVNISTVSRALNNSQNISSEVKNEVIEFANKYHYQKRKLKANNILYIIDKILFSSANQFFNRLIEGIEEESKNNNLFFSFNTLTYSKSSIYNLNVNLNKVAGIIISGCYHDDFILEAKKLNIPIVLIDYYLPTENISSVLIDNTDGVIIGIKYLSALGHKRIGFLPTDYKNDIGMGHRLIGYHRAVEMFNLEKDENLIINSDFTMDSAYVAMKKFLLSNKNYPTAIMGANDMVAIGASKAIMDQRLKIPQDISVLGFDDIPLSAEVRPKLSTLHVRKKTMGILAVKRLIKIIKGEDIELNKIIIRPELLIRESTSKIQDKLKK